MKKNRLFLIFILTILAVSIMISSFSVTASAETENAVIDRNAYINNSDYQADINPAYALNYYSYIYLYEFQKLFPDRTSGSDNEKKAAEYIASKFLSLGLSGYEEGKYIKMFNGTSNFQNYKNIDSSNVIGIKKAASETKKQVIIGAHYDNAYKILNADANEEKKSSEGAFDNGTGIAAMLSIIELIKNDVFDFNIVFIAFGAEEIGAVGSTKYVNGMTKEEIDNTLLMVNLESISGGDNLYLYCDEFSTEHEKYIHDNVLSELNLFSPPKNKNIAMSGTTLDPRQHETFRYPYYHNGLMADNTPFMLKGINTAYFFSGYWEDNVKLEKESKDHGDIRYTENDNLKKLEELYGEEVYKRMDNLAKSLSAILKKTDFTDTMASSKAHKKNYFYLLNYKVIDIFYYVIKVVFAVIVIIIAVRLNKLRRGAGGNGSDNPQIFVTPKKDESVFKDFDI